MMGGMTDEVLVKARIEKLWLDAAMDTEEGAEAAADVLRESARRSAAQLDRGALAGLLGVLASGLLVVAITALIVAHL